MDITTLNEDQLVVVGNAISKQGHPIGVPFCQYTEDHINHHNGAELTDVGSPEHFGDERDDPVG